MLAPVRKVVHMFCTGAEGSFTAERIAPTEFFQMDYFREEVAAESNP